jgi:hypothetical protein
MRESLRPGRAPNLVPEECREGMLRRENVQRGCVSAARLLRKAAGPGLRRAHARSPAEKPGAHIPLLFFGLVPLALPLSIGNLKSVAAKTIHAAEPIFVSCRNRNN